MNHGTGSLVLSLVEGEAAVVTAHLAGFGIIKSDDVEEQGTLDLDEIEELTSGRWSGGATATVPFARYSTAAARFRAGRLGFDSMKLDPRSNPYLLLALSVIPGAPSPEVVVVTSIQSRQAPLVKDVRAILAIERAAEEERRPLLEAALEIPGLQRTYAHYAIGRLRRIPRQQGVELERKVALDPERSTAERSEAQATLDLELWDEDQLVDALNLKIVSANLELLRASSYELQSQAVNSVYRSANVALDRGLDLDALRQSATHFESFPEKTLPSTEALKHSLDALAGDDEVGQRAQWLARMLGSH